MAEEQATRSTGKVVFFNDKRGFGFIKPDDGGEDLFVHHTAIKSDGGYRTLSEDEAVEFTVAPSEDSKYQAVDVTSLGGGPIQPSNNWRGSGIRDGFVKRGGAGFGGLRNRRNDGGNYNGNGGAGCYNCGNPGHIARECNDGRAGGCESGPACYSCGTVGHFARDCPVGNNGSGNDVVNGGGGGRGGRGCFTCGELGHVARDCRSGGVTGSCYTCGGVGHLARDCPSPVTSTRGTGRPRGGAVAGRSSRGSGCFHCGKEGHFARECPANA